MNTPSPWTFCIAPMMGWTDRHFRYLFRLIAPSARLYTEMVTAGALIHGDAPRFLAYDPFEHPLALQLGGANPTELAHCAKLAQDYGYDEVNLNVGCPSDRVQSGAFGACLMAKPDLVAECVAAMQLGVDIPVTVKCRVGIDDLDSDEYFFNFIETVAQAGCKVFIIHARKAWLNGLSPKENREVPELNIERAAKLKTLRPDLTIVLNGGVNTVEDCKQYQQTFDGVMVGRAAYHDPFRFNVNESLTRIELVERYCDYIEARLSQGVPLKSITRHMLNLFNGEPNAKRWRRFLSQTAHKPGAGVSVIKEALNIVQSAVLFES